MELKERNETKLQEAFPSKLNTAEVVLKESKNFLGNVNTLNMTDEEEERQSSSEGVTSFFNAKQQRKWNLLSENRKRSYLAKADNKHKHISVEQDTKLSVKEQSAQLNIKSETSSIGKHVARDSAGQSTVAGAGSVATGGVLLAGEAAKKTADKFKESLTRKAAEQTEHFRQFRNRMESQQEGNKKSNDFEGAGKFLAVSAGVFIGVLMIVILPILIMFLGSAAAGNGSNKLVDVAKAELEVSEYNIGGTKYKEWYGLDDNWCAMFVAWCGNECGFIEDGTMVKSASVSESKNWYEEKEQYQTKESGYIPEEGDLVFFLNGMSHIGIVISYNSTLDQITVIEGNSGASSTTPYHAGSRVTQNVYQRNAESISGYGTPVYPEIEEDVEENEEDLLAGGEGS